MQQRLIYVMDPMCSWCWGLAPLLDSIRAEFPELPVHLVAGSLRAHLDTPLDNASRQALADHWQAVAALSGQPFSDPHALPDSLVFNVGPASRALIAARNLDECLAWPFARAVQHAFYAQGLDITQPAVLMQIAADIGYDEALFAARFDHPETRQQLEQDWNWVADRGFAELPILFAERKGRLALLCNGFRVPGEVLALLQRWVAAAA